MPDSSTEIKDGALILRQLRESGRICLALHGELDLANAATLETSLGEALASGDEVVVDLAKLEFLDSTGIALLVSVLQSPGAERLSFLPSESTEVHRLLTMTGLEERLGFDRSASHTTQPAA
ncbi:MAG TPA: STAS domain-containing protein [Solirubrobacterales bacterium]|nr:STAS domain-containing protein [Solirubrobacterales bacterium]